jgi:hypothetical protein
MKGLNKKIHIFDKKKSQLTSFTLSHITLNMTVGSG